MTHRAEDRLDEPLDEEERVLMDPDTWDWNTAQVLETSARTGVVLAGRLTREELTRIEEAAHAAGTSLTEFVKQAALLRALNGARA